MTDPDRLLKKMEDILKELIFIAEQLRQISTHVVSESDIHPLQDKQEQLLEKLQKVDKQYQESTQEKKPAKNKEIQQMLDYFEKLNEEFIENIRKTSGLIQFEVRKGKEKK